jgi:hypothetical protein
VSKGSLSCSILNANKFAVLETLKSLEFSTHGCNAFISTDVTELDLQSLRHPCFVPLVTDVIKE